MSFASVHNGITSRNNGNEKESSSLSATTTSVVEMTGTNTNASSASPFSSQTTTPVSAHDNNREPVVATTSNRHEVEEELDLNIISSHDMDLSMLQAAALLTADCMGTGLLALPQDIQVLGGTFGFIALIVNLPIAWYAGFLLSQTARRVEGKELYTDHDHDKEHDNEHHGHETIPEGDGLVRVVVSSAVKKAAYSSVEKGDNEESIANIVLDDDSNKPHRYDDSNTQDYIGITRVIFHHLWATRVVTTIFYANLFLVLGDYILVMAHAVQAFVGAGGGGAEDDEDSRMCLPTAGLVASTLMFGFSQLRTMGQLGRSVTLLSLACLAIVVVQCLVAVKRNEQAATSAYTPPSDETTALRKFSALASIGFATGSNKLLLNIRNEMKHREEAPKTLGIALSLYGFVYVVICLLAGPNPPSFLFDSIPSGLSRRVAGLLLWIHVAVSYAINSQAICSSMDRIFFHRVARFALDRHPKRRWLVLTLFLTVSSYVVANAVPFFKDLVALIGALTSVPLSLIFPAMLYRHQRDLPLCCPTRFSLASYALLVFGLVYLAVGLTGALNSIELDWENQGPAFACSV